MKTLSIFFLRLPGWILAKYMICKGLDVPKFFYTLAFFGAYVYALTLYVCPLIC